MTDTIDRFFRLNHYILKEKVAVGIDTSTPDGLIRWGRWMEEADRHVADEAVCGFRVSTVFLGLDYQFGQGPPILFETMVFHADSTTKNRTVTIDGVVHILSGNYFDEEEYTQRYSTWQEAERGHKTTVEDIRRRVIRAIDDRAVNGD